MTSIAWKNGPILRSGAIGTAQACCCGPSNPCSVLIDGELASLSSFDPYEVVSASWDGLSTPGRDRIYTDGVLTYDFGPTRDRDSVVQATTIGCDSGQQNISRQVILGPGYQGTSSGCGSTSQVQQHVLFGFQAVNASICRLFGGVSTAKIQQPCLVGGAWSIAERFEESIWTWECFIVNGVPGEVTVSPSYGAIYAAGVTPICQVTLSAPEVTLTFAP